MRFGEVMPEDAEGAILAHSMNEKGIKWKKGRVLKVRDIRSLINAGINRVTVAQMEPGDIGENAAASQIASIIQGDGVTVSKPFTGRVNLIARSDGLLKLNQKVIESLNLVDESVTVATISHYARVSENQIVATIKIIPFLDSRCR